MPEKSHNHDLSTYTNASIHPPASKLMNLILFSVMNVKFNWCSLEMIKYLGNVKKRDYIDH